MSKLKMTIGIIITALVIVGIAVIITTKDTKEIQEYESGSSTQLDAIREEFGQDAIIEKGFVIEFKDGHIQDIYERTDDNEE